jgi:hypothetical protein
MCLYKADLPRPSHRSQAHGAKLRMAARLGQVGLSANKAGFVNKEFENLSTDIVTLDN